MKFALLLISLPAFAATYYISASGADSNNGTSQGTPWQTITKVNAGTYAAGDSILFHGGDTFSGTVTLALTGTATARITVSSYGTGNATISSGTGDGMDFGESEFLTVSNLIVTGSGWTGGEPLITVLNGGTGISFVAARTSGLPYRSVAVSGCTVSGYQVGIFFDTRAGASLVGWQGIAISGNDTSGNLTFGVFLQGYNADAGGPVDQIKDVYIGHNVLRNIPGDPNSGTGGVHGSVRTEAAGINAGSITGITIEKNYLSGIAGYGGLNSGLTFGGSCAVCLTNARAYRIDSNEITNTACSTHFDGSAIDIDQDTQNGEIAYNLTYGNVGPSIQAGSFGGKTTGGRVHHNVSYNDARGNSSASEQGAIRLWGSTSGIQIFSNTIYVSASGTAGTPSAINWETGSNVAITIMDNIFKVTGGMAVYRANTGSNPTHIGSPVMLENLYDASGGSLLISNDTGAAYSNVTSLAAWQGDGYETLTSINYGIVADSGMASLGGFSPPAGGFLANGAWPSNFDLSAATAGVGTGLDPWIESTDLGPVDFHALPARYGASLDIGAAAYVLPAVQTGVVTLRGGAVIR